MDEFGVKQKSFLSNIMLYGTDKMKIELMYLHHKSIIRATQRMQQEAIFLGTTESSFVAKFIVITKTVIDSVIDYQKQLNDDFRAKKEKANSEAEKSKLKPKNNEDVRIIRESHENKC